MKVKQAKGFAEFRQSAMAAEPVRGMFALKGIEIHDSEHITANGLNMSLTPRALGDIARICGLTSGGSRNILRSGENGAKVLDIVKQASLLAKKAPDMRIMLQADRDGTVNRAFSSKNAPLMDYKYFFDVADRYLNTDNFEIVGNSIDRRGNLTIELVRPGLEHQVEGMPNELFKVGATLRFSEAGEISLSSNNVRKLCDNGMIMVGGNTYRNRSFVQSLWQNTVSDPKKLTEWVNRASQLKALDYTEPALDARIKTASKTTASFDEVMQVDSLVRTELFGSPTEDSPISIREWSNPDVCTTAYNKKGILWESYSAPERQQLRADRTVWDLVNQLTHLASHEVPGVEVSDSSRMALKVRAGAMLMQPFNLENHVPVQAF